MKLLVCIMLLNIISFASARGYGHTHSVRGYTRSNGTYVKGHLSGNPYSGIHCHNSICN